MSSELLSHCVVSQPLSRHSGCAGGLVPTSHTSLEGDEDDESGMQIEQLDRLNGEPSLLERQMTKITHI